MTEADYIRVEDGNVVISGADVDSSDPDSVDATGYLSLGCIIGDVTISDGYETITVAASNWCTAGSSILNQKRIGNRDITISMTLEMDLSDPATLAALLAFKNKASYFIRDVATDNNAVANSYTGEYRGKWTQFDRVYQQAGTARFNTSYFVDKILQDSVVA